MMNKAKNIVVVMMLTVFLQACSICPTHATTLTSRSHHRHVKPRSPTNSPWHPRVQLSPLVPSPPPPHNQPRRLPPLVPSPPPPHPRRLPPLVPSPPPPRHPRRLPPIVPSPPPPRRLPPIVLSPPPPFGFLPSAPPLVPSPPPPAVDNAPFVFPPPPESDDDDDDFPIFTPPPADHVPDYFQVPVFH